MSSRLRRRALLTAPTLAVAAVAGSTATAEAAPPGTAWTLGGTNNVTTNGTNWLGTRNAAPLIIKTGAAERMRVQPGGRVGIGTAAPSSPLEVTGAAANEGVVRATTTTAGDHAAVRGIATKAASGGWFSGRTSGVRGQGVGNASQGVFATGTYGVRAFGDQYGVAGATNPGTGALAGVWGRGPNGVRGDGITGGTGVHGTGFFGMVAQGDSIGILASGDPDSQGLGQGVHASGRNAVWADGTDTGVRASGASRGIYAVTPTTGAGKHAGYFAGNVWVGGTLSKEAGAFVIDHPLDPEHRWLRHSFVESPDMMNVYNGNVALDDAGEATVELPDYFTALNRDFRYQLTPLRGAAPDLHVSETIADGRFRIGGGPAGLEVSWQVTGIRQDDYARANPIVVEERKSRTDRGSRLFVPEGSRARHMDHEPVAEQRP